MVVQDKLAWRRVLRARRDAMPEAERRILSARIGEELLAEPHLLAARRVALYAAVRSEVATAGLHAGLHARGTELFYPRIVRASRTLEFAPAHDPAALRPGPFGIPEPTGDPIALAAIDVVVLPGLGFDRRGVRLGMGAGYYDRALLGYAGLSVGVAFACQLVDELPEEAGDRRVDLLVTDRQVLALRPLGRGERVWPS